MCSAAFCLASLRFGLTSYRAGLADCLPSGPCCPSFCLQWSSTRTIGSLRYRSGWLWPGLDMRSGRSEASKFRNPRLAVQDLRSSRQQSNKVAGNCIKWTSVSHSQNEGVALGFLGTRVLEASTIFADVVCLLAIVTLRRTGVGADALVTGKALVALYGLFRLGQNLMPAINDLLLGSLLYQSRLVPRVLPLLGFIGAPLLIANTIMFMFGITSGPIYVLTGIGVLPIALFEFSLGVWLTVKGFNPSAITSLPATNSNLVAEPLVP
jgi:hypothetical protein